MRVWIGNKRKALDPSTTYGIQNKRVCDDCDCRGVPQGQMRVRRNATFLGFGGRGDEEEEEEEEAGSDEEDAEAEALATPGSEVTTTGQAYEFCQRLLDGQVQRAVHERSFPNKPIAGDTKARNAFYTLLDDSQQRRLFLQLAGDRDAWPRVRSLFGAPPFDFLHPEDASVLRAGGFASGRVHMAHPDHPVACSYSQFGAGQLEDQYERRYRIVRQGRFSTGPEAPLPFDLEFHDKSSGVTLHVRVRRRRRTLKMQMMQSPETRIKLRFPLPGEVLSVRATKQMRALRGLAASQSAHKNDHHVANIKILRVMPRSAGALTAAVVAMVV